MEQQLGRDLHKAVQPKGAGRRSTPKGRTPAVLAARPIVFPDRTPDLAPSRAYLDSAVLHFPTLPGSKANIRRHMRIVGDDQRLRFDRVKTDKGDHGWLVSLHQPQPVDLPRFNDIQRGGDGKLFRVDTALDLPPGEGMTREQLRAWVEACVILKNRQQGWMYDYEETAYWVFQAERKKRSEIDIALYSDLPGKLGDVLPVHLELRVQNTRACRRNGFDNVEDLLNLNPAEHFANHIRLVNYDPRKLFNERLKQDARAFWDRARAKHNQQQREGKYAERYRLNLARHLDNRLRRLNLYRGQIVKDYQPNYFRTLKSLSIDILRIPQELEWGALKQKGNYHKTVWTAGWSWG